MRRSLVVAGIIIAAPLLCALVILLINTRWFDEPLTPALAALAPGPVTPAVERDAYALAFGFLAASDRDPYIAGRQIIDALRLRFEQGRSITLSDAEMQTILGDGPAAAGPELSGRIHRGVPAQGGR